MNVGVSSMHKKTTIPIHTQPDVIQHTLHRCGVDKKCNFRLKEILKRDSTVSFELLGDRVHSNHELRGPARANSVVNSMTEHLISDARAEGITGLDLTNAVMNRSSALGIELTPRIVHTVRKGIDQRKLMSRLLKNSTVSCMYKVGDEILNIGNTPHSEASREASAALGILAKLQQKDTTAYIRVRVVEQVVIYIFISTTAMRIKGSRFGETRLFDDKHGASSSAYHLAACTVQTNTTVQPVAFAFMESSNGDGWNEFISDCHRDRKSVV